MIENLKRIIEILEKAEKDIYNVFDINNVVNTIPFKEHLVTIVGNKGKRFGIGRYGRETDTGFIVTDTYDFFDGKVKGTTSKNKNDFHLEDPTPEEISLYLSQFN